MKNRMLLLTILVIWTLFFSLQTRRGLRQLRASVILYQVEGMTQQTASGSPRLAAILERNLILLDHAAELDPVSVGIPVAQGSQYLLLGRYHAAIRAYERALALEPRPETYLNLGRAQVLAGEKQVAEESFRAAVSLDPHLRKEIPEPLRSELLLTRPAR